MKNSKISEILRSHNIEPITELILIARETEDEKLKTKIYQSLIEFVYPRLNRVEIDASQHYALLMEESLAKLKLLKEQHEKEF